MFCDDGRNGLERFAPYDVIFVGASVDKVSPDLFDQLKKGGRIIVSVGMPDVSQFMIMNKEENGNMTSVLENSQVQNGGN